MEVAFGASPGEHILARTDDRAGDLLRRHLREVPPHRALLRSVECQLMGSVVLQPPVLDVGCGDGHFGALAYGRVLEVGTDLPKVALPSADLTEAVVRGAYRWVLAADATALPFADNAFQTVVSNSVVEHIANMDAALHEIARVLAPHGTFAFTTPSERFGDFLLGTALLRRCRQHRLAAAYVRWFDRISVHHHRLDPSAWHEKLAGLGLTVRHWRYYFSERTHHVFDLCHYLGAPTLIFRRLTGHWVPARWVSRPLQRWLEPYATAAPQRAGAYLFFLCEKGGVA